MKQHAWLISIAVLFVGCITFNNLRAQTSPVAAASDFEKPIQAYQLQIASWEREADIEIAFVVAVIVFGALISALQGAKWRRAKTATLLLGVATSILTGINSNIFSADHRTLRQAAMEGRAVSVQLSGIAALLEDQSLTGPNRLSTQGEYLKRLAELQSISARVEGSNQTASTSSRSENGGFLSLSSVYAQSGLAVPPWVQNLPSDKSSVYCLGKGYDASLANAKANSLNNAFNSALQLLKPDAPNVPDSDLLALIKNSAIVQDSAFTYDSRTRIYTYYTLLRMSEEIRNSGIRSLSMTASTQLSATVIKQKGWRPTDLTFNPTSGLFVLDSNGGVSRLVTDHQGTRLEKMFRLDGAYSGSTVAASAESVFVASTSQLGCTVFKYDLTSKAVSERLMFVNEDCTGIATDGSALYLTMPNRKEIRYWNTWDAHSSRSWSLGDSDRPGSIVFDAIGHRLIVADASGRAYAISLADGRKQLLASNLGAVTSIAASRLHILLASGKKVLFLARSDNHGENPPAGLESLSGGHIVGVCVDGTDKLWFADFDNAVVEGPFPLSQASY